MDRVVTNSRKWQNRNCGSAAFKSFVTTSKFYRTEFFLFAYMVYIWSNRKALLCFSYFFIPMWEWNRAFTGCVFLLLSWNKSLFIIIHSDEIAKKSIMAPRPAPVRVHVHWGRLRSQH